jgi:hypothetical protein
MKNVKTDVLLSLMDICLKERVRITFTLGFISFTFSDGINIVSKKVNLETLLNLKDAFKLNDTIRTFKKEAEKELNNKRR